MKILSFNCMGLENPSKKLSLRQLKEAIPPDVILIHESMGIVDMIKSTLETLLYGCTFQVVDARGHLGGLALWLENEGLQM